MSGSYISTAKTLYAVLTLLSSRHDNMITRKVLITLLILVFYSMPHKFDRLENSTLLVIKTRISHRGEHAN